MWAKDSMISWWAGGKFGVIWHAFFGGWCGDSLEEWGMGECGGAWRLLCVVTTDCELLHNSSCLQHCVVHLKEYDLVRFMVQKSSSDRWVKTCLAAVTLGAIFLRNEEVKDKERMQKYLGRILRKLEKQIIGRKIKTSWKKDKSQKLVSGFIYFSFFQSLSM